MPDRPSLLQRMLGVFVVLAFFLVCSVGRQGLVPRPVENVYLDARRLAALRTLNAPSFR